MGTPTANGSLPAPFFHHDSGSVRFWVGMAQAAPVGAIVGKEVLHYRFRAALDGSDAVTVYEAHRAEIDSAVRRRLAHGSLEPVMLREADLPAPPPG